MPTGDSPVPAHPHPGWMSEARAQLSSPVRSIWTQREPSGSRRAASWGKERRGSLEELFLKRKIKKMHYAQGQATFVLGTPAALVLRRGGELGEQMRAACPFSRPRRAVVGNGTRALCGSLTFELWGLGQVS